MTKTEATATFFIPPFSISPPSSSIVLKIHLLDLPTTQGRFGDLLIYVDNSADQKVFPETLLMTKEASTSVGTGGVCVPGLLTAGSWEWKCYFLKELHLLWFICASSSPE